jgi:N-acyl-L-homoserine lactone synthetase
MLSMMGGGGKTLEMCGGWRLIPGYYSRTLNSTLPAYLEHNFLAVSHLRTGMSNII